MGVIATLESQVIGDTGIMFYRKSVCVYINHSTAQHWY